MRINKIHVVLLLSVILAVTAVSQSSGLKLPVWDGRRYQFPTLGSGFVVSNGVISIAPSTSTSTRKFGQVLVYDLTTAAWVLPPNANNIVVYVNGLRYTQGIDYEYMQATNGTYVRALGTNMGATDHVIVDYE
jgi:hypothetical protein